MKIGVSPLSRLSARPGRRERRDQNWPTSSPTWGISWSPTCSSTALGESSRVPELHPAVALSPPTRCRDPGRRARTYRSPLKLPHRFSSPPLSQTWKHCPLRPRSPLPPRGPRSRAGLGETRPPPRGPPSPGCAHRRVKGADRPPRCALAVLRAARPAARRRVAPPAPPKSDPRAAAAAANCSIFGFYYTFTYWSELASERERARGRAGGGRREGRGAGGGRRRRREQSIPQTSFLLQWRSRTGPVSLQGDPKQAPWSSSQSYSSRKTVFLSLCPPFPTQPQIHLHFTVSGYFFFSSDSFSPPPPSPSPMI